jgi:hypothetical protein
MKRSNVTAMLSGLAIGVLASHALARRYEILRGDQPMNWIPWFIVLIIGLIILLISIERH